MIKRILKRAFLLVFLAGPLSASADENEFNKLFVFGDSLSDNGNLVLLLPEFVPNPPYAEGKFSDGPLAVEVIADELDIDLIPVIQNPLEGNNFAVAGARARTDRMFLNLPEQIYNFLNSPSSYVPSDALYVVFIGGNDVRDALLAGGGTVGDGIVRAAVANVRTAITDLIDAGALHILAPNVPNLGAIPEVPDFFFAEATRLSELYNSVLAFEIASLEAEFGIDIIEFDTFGFLNSILRNADELEFEDTENACIFSVPFPFDCEEFVFFDTIHPTTRIHELVGEEIVELLEGDDDDDDDNGDDDD